MSAELIALLTVIVTAIIGPLLAFAFKRWAEAQLLKQKQNEENAASEKKDEANTVNTGKSSEEINNSIDKQASSMDDWIKKS